MCTKKGLSLTNYRRGKSAKAAKRRTLICLRGHHQMPSSRRGDCGSTQPPRGTAHAGERGNVGARKIKVPGGEPGLRLRSCSGSVGNKFHRPGGRECTQVAPGGRLRPTGGPRGNQFSQRLIRRGKRWSAILALTVNNQDWFWARKIRSWHRSLLEKNYR